jgi:hypothetical protein
MRLSLITEGKMMNPRMLWAVLAVVLVGAACGTSEDDTGPFSVAEAVDLQSDAPVVVRGFLVVNSDGQNLLADSLLESHPPQAGDSTVVVRGLDLGSIPRLQRFDGDSPIQTVAWTDDLIELRGIVSGDTLTLSGGSS